MTKIMLVIENQSDQDFLEKILKKLSFMVVTLKKGSDLSEQLIDHFPDLVFASILGKNEKALNALGKIKESRGKPKLVFVRQERETEALNDEQQRVVDSVLYSPIDPFKLIDVLAATTGVDVQELRSHYNQVVLRDRKIGADKMWVESGQQDDYGTTTLINSEVASQEQQYQNTDAAPAAETHIQLGKEAPEPETHVASSVTTPLSAETVVQRPLNPNQESDVQKVTTETGSVDPVRKKKYDAICAELKKNSKPHKAIDGQKLREKQAMQSREVKEDVGVRENRKHFIKTLFSMVPNKKN